MIASCLVKDPSKRPSAKKLLKHSFFKQARSNDYITRTLLDGLPALGDRIKALKVYHIVLMFLEVNHFTVFFILLGAYIVSFPAAEEGRRHACTEENARWAKGGNITGLNLCILLYSWSC